MQLLLLLREAQGAPPPNTPTNFLSMHRVSPQKANKNRPYLHVSIHTPSKVLWNPPLAGTSPSLSISSTFAVSKAPSQTGPPSTRKSTKALLQAAGWKL